MSITRPLMITLIMALIATMLTTGTAAQPQSTNSIYLPIVNLPAATPVFGFETSAGRLSNSAVRARAAELGATWVRINAVLWHQIQPVQGGPYNWDVLAALDRDLAAAHALGLTPTVIIRGTPLWASINDTTCAAVRDEHLGAYADFLEALATRYRDRVNYWEMGNEPDVDPSLILDTFPFGCYGDLSDPYHGGERYGRMLQVAAPALRRGNPAVKIIFGGLLLGSVTSDVPTPGKPEWFFEGALRAGAGNSFDIIAAHSYPNFQQATRDHDVNSGGMWDNYGGWTIGKAFFLRQTMARYGVSKPIWLNEIGLLSRDRVCLTPQPDLFPAQAEHLVRIMARASANQIEMMAWYTLNGPGWCSAGLLNERQEPRPAFNAYKHMIALTSPYRNVTSVNYGPDIEAYRFHRGPTVVDVLWRRSPGTSQASVPLVNYIGSTSLYGANDVAGTFIPITLKDAAYRRPTADRQQDPHGCGRRSVVSGNAVPSMVIGISDGNALLNVGFTPIYIERRP